MGKMDVFSFSGEALGAIGSEQVLPLLQEYSKDPVIEVWLKVCHGIVLPGAYLFFIHMHDKNHQSKLKNYNAPSWDCFWSSAYVYCSDDAIKEKCDIYFFIIYQIKL